MATPIDPRTIHNAGEAAAMAYTHCKTRIVDLSELNIPEIATEDEYKVIYDRISRLKSLIARDLTDAINSVSFGIAPPVAFPTETVYGLGADATNRASIAGIFAAKGRPSDNPLIVHVASVGQLERLTGERLPAIYQDLVRIHWPGPLTILIPIPKDNSIFAPNVHPGQRTIGFRIPESKYARFFIAATGKPIAGPSANSSGKPSPTTAQHVLDDLDGKINYILDGGNCNVGVESTVVDGLCNPPLILRPGGLSQDDLIAHGKRHNNAWTHVGIGYKQTRNDHHETHGTNGDVTTHDTVTANEAPRAPGMKYKHYAPQGQMLLLEGPTSLQRVQSNLDKLIETIPPPPPPPPPPDPTSTTQLVQPQPLTIVILTTTTWPHFANLPTNTNSTTLPSSNPNPDSTNSIPPPVRYGHHTIHSIALGKSPKEIARNLFAALRTCDDLRCRIIVAEAPARGGPVVPVNGEGPGDGAGVGNEHRDGDRHRHGGRFGDEKCGDGGGRESTDSDDGSSKFLVHRFDAVVERMRKAASLVVGD